MTNPLVDHLMVSQDYMLFDHMTFKSQRGQMTGQVTWSPDISQDHMFGDLFLWLGYSWGLGEVS
jgi:hypothetical protein